MEARCSPAREVRFWRLRANFPRGLPCVSLYWMSARGEQLQPSELRGCGAPWPLAAANFSLPRILRSTENAIQASRPSTRQSSMLAVSLRVPSSPADTPETTKHPQFFFAASHWMINSPLRGLVTQLRRRHHQHAAPPVDVSCKRKQKAGLIQCQLPQRFHLRYRQATYATPGISRFRVTREVRGIALQLISQLEFDDESKSKISSIPRKR